jgi:histidinol-phosphate aminotransferase
VSVQLRPVLGSLPSYVPGRAIPGAIKLASNETPYPPLPHVVAQIAAAAAGINRYPDNASGALRDALAARHDVQPGQVAVGCGSVALCTQLVQAVADADDQVVYAWRSFEAYPIIAAISAAESVQVPLRDHVHDLDAMAEQITGKTRLVLVCNPNNPTGTVVSRADLIAFLRRVPPDVVVALDEAYREFVTDPAVADGLTLLAQHPNVVVLRTFSKAYGLAGMRVGYAIAADPAITAALRQTQVPFAVNGLAQVAALASLEPAAEEQLMRRVDDTVAERDRVQAELIAAGYDVPPSQANFVWLPLGAATTAWAAGCEDRGVIVRGFADAGVRVTIGSAPENDRLLAAARELATAR